MHTVTYTYPDGRKELWVDGKLVWSQTPEEYVRQMKEFCGVEMRSFTW